MEDYVTAGVSFNPTKTANKFFVLEVCFSLASLLQEKKRIRKTLFNPWSLKEFYVSASLTEMSLLEEHLFKGYIFRN